MAILYTFKDLQDKVLRTLDEAGDTTTTLDLVKDYLNAAHSARCGQEPWTFLRWDRPETFTLTSGQRFYGLHPELWKPIYFFNRATNQYLVEITERQLAATGMNWNTQTGATPYFRFAGYTPVQTQPATTGTLTIESTSAADNTAAKAITLLVETSMGVTSESVTPTGTTPVATSASVERVLGVTKGATWTGNLTIKDASGNTLLQLFPTELGRNHPQLELLASPTSADVIEYRFVRSPRLLVNDNDIPDIPAPYSLILVWDALILFAGYNTDTSPQSLAMWTNLESALETDMRKLYLEGSTLEAEPRFIRDVEADGDGYPRVVA